MGSICLSSASILRCGSLTTNQNIFLIIPTVLELIFSISLVFIDHGPGKRNMLVMAEGLSFFTLVILELLSQIIPAVQGDLGLFKAFDFAIGISSFIPIALYTIFLYLLTNAEIVGALPRRIKKIIKLALALFIPAIVAFNEVASFIGVSIRSIPAGQPPETVITIGFSSPTQQELWAFFNSLTLALLTSYQAAVFCFAFFRLTLAILDQRKIESQGSDKAHLIKGTGWLSASLKLGAIETVIGFAGGGFGIALTRRILRLLARACMCIGVAKGVDLVEDFHALRNELSLAEGGGKFRRRESRKVISNLRYGSFQQLSPKPTTFRPSQASDVLEKSTTYKTLTTAGLPDMVHFSDTNALKGQRRVTVRYHHGTPSLHMRFSMLDIPNSTIVADEMGSRPRSDLFAPLSRPQPIFNQSLQSVFRDSADSATSFTGPFEIVAAPRRMLSQRSARAQLYRAASSATSGDSQHPDPTVEEVPDTGQVQSARTIRDSLQAVQDLAGQFPGPPMISKDQNTFINPSTWKEVPTEPLPKPQALGSPSELQFKEQRKSDDSAWSSTRSFGFSDTKSTRSSRQPTLYTVTETPFRSAHLHSEKPIDPFNDEEEDARSPSTATTADKETPGAPVPGFNSSQNHEARTEDVLDLTTTFDAGKPQVQPQSSRQESPYESDEKITPSAEQTGSSSGVTKPLPVAEVPTKSPRRSRERGMSIDHLTIPWLKTADMEEEDRRLLRAMSKRDMLNSRVKSIGKAPRKSTPRPIPSGHKRGSTHLKPIVIPPRSTSMPEIVDDYEYGSLQSTASGEGIRRDSGVFGIHGEGSNYF